MSRPRWTIRRGMGAVVVVVGLALAVLRTSSLRLMGVVVLVAYAALLASTSVAIQPSPWPFVRGYAIAAWLSLAILTLPRLIPAPLVVGLPSDMIFRLYRVVRSGRPMTIREVRAFGGFVCGMLDIAGGIGGDSSPAGGPEPGTDRRLNVDARTRPAR